MAIAFDSFTRAAGSTVTSVDVVHTHTGSLKILGLSISAWDASAPVPNVTTVEMDPDGTPVSMVRRKTNPAAGSNNLIELWDAGESIVTASPVTIRTTFDATISNVHVAAFTLTGAAQQAPVSTDTDEQSFPTQNHSHTLTITDNGSLALGLFMGDLASSFWAPQNSQTEEFDSALAIGITSSLNWLSVDISDSPITLGCNGNDNSNNSVSIGAIYAPPLLVSSRSGAPGGPGRRSRFLGKGRQRRNRAWWVS